MQMQNLIALKKDKNHCVVVGLDFGFKILR